MSLALLSLAFLLGIKHSYDADHLVAVGTILHRARTFSGAVKIGVSWAIGHMLTAGSITIVLFLLKDSILGTLLSYFEMITAVLLIALGIFALHTAIFSVYRNVGDTRLEARDHAHHYMLGIGVIHGLASNDELLTLLVASLGVATLGGMLLGVGVFSLGVVFGMLAFCAAFSIPWIRVQDAYTQKILAFVTGSISIIYGTTMLFGMQI